jgi:MFS family permease
MRARLEESPEFVRMKAAKQLSDAPVLESLGRWANVKLIGLVLLGVVAAQAAVWGAAQFYSLMFLLNTLKVDFRAAYVICGIALVLGTAFYVVAGWLSDRVGRKPVMLCGMALFAIEVFPCYRLLAEATNPALMEVSKNTPIEVSAPAGACKVNLFAKPESQCDRARDLLTKAGLVYRFTSLADPAAPVTVRVGNAVLAGESLDRIHDELRARGWSPSADPERMRPVMAVGALLVLIAASAAIYGPLAAYLVELFPARIRYTSLSVPYHIGNGVFAGMLPFVVAAISVHTGNIFAGLWYPVGVAAMSFVVCLLFLPETLHRGEVR